jgi:predicted ATPase
MDIVLKPRKFVITGGPHSGKTSVLEELKKRGMKVVPEGPRMIIEKELNKERILPGYQPILPGARQEEFNQLVLEKQLELEKQVKSGNVFLDRSLVDPIAYAEHFGVDPHPELHRHIEDAGYGTVFFLQQVPGYQQDEQRMESKEEGQRIHQKIFEVYTRLGFDVKLVDVFEIGDQGIEKRADFIIEQANGSSGKPGWG